MRRSIFRVKRTYAYLLLLIVGLGWIWVSRSVPAVDGVINYSVPRKGFIAPDFILSTLLNDPMQLSDIRGRPVLINFWASWCPPCKAEMPVLDKIYQLYKTNGLLILGINTTNQDSEKNASEFVSNLNLSFPILLDKNGKVTNLYQVN
jgi:thiol-disulfide isomerase/thioredoxin